jgi:lipoate---protein ligase
MSQLKVILSDSFNPHLNLATEEWIFHHMDPSSQVLFIWRNEETVVIGRNQNPWSECNLSQMKEDHVHLARRTTGGGAVFHDLGNTNFTFLSPKDGYRRDNNIKIILEALAELGIVGEASGRNDLVMPAADGPRKFSGSAYREKADRAFHHGTLLINANLSRLANYLTPNPKKLQAKGKESVRARVMNLSEAIPGLAHVLLSDRIINSFESFYGGRATRETLNLDSLRSNAELRCKYEELSSWDWLYGRTLEFTHQMDQYLSLGFFDFHFKVEDARIVDLQIYSDCLYPALIELFKEELNGKNYSAASIEGVQKNALGIFPEHQVGINELAGWLKQQLEI